MALISRRCALCMRWPLQTRRRRRRRRRRCRMLACRPASRTFWPRLSTFARARLRARGTAAAEPRCAALLAPQTAATNSDLQSRGYSCCWGATRATCCRSWHEKVVSVSVVEHHSQVTSHAQLPSQSAPVRRPSDLPPAASSHGPAHRRRVVLVFARRPLDGERRGAGQAAGGGGPAHAAGAVAQRERRQRLAGLGRVGGGRLEAPPGCARPSDAARLPGARPSIQLSGRSIVASCAPLCPVVRAVCAASM